jgi:hypothetical protein
MTIRINGSHQGGIAVTTSDTVNIAFPANIQYSRAIRVNVAGSVVLVMADNSVVTLANLAADVDHPYAVKRVNATGTTATGITAFY